MPQGLKEIQARKLELAALADAQRAGLVEEMVVIQSKLRWVEVVRSLLGRLKPGLAVVFPLAGYFLASGSGRAGRGPGVVQKISGLWQLVTKVRSFYAGIQTARRAIQGSSATA